MISYVILLLLILVAIVYIYLNRNHNYWKCRNVPHNRPIVCFGNMLSIVIGKEWIGKYLANLYDKFEAPYFGFFVIDRPHLVLKDPKIIEKILTEDFHYFQNRFLVCDEEVDSIIANSLLGIKQPHLGLLRSNLEPVFCSGNLNMMFNLMKECGKNLENYIGTTLHASVEVMELCNKYASDAIATCAFGLKTNSFLHVDDKFTTASRKLFEKSFLERVNATCYFFAPQLVKLFKLRFIPRGRVQFLRAVFIRFMKQREVMETQRNDLIDILIGLKAAEANNEKFRFYEDRLVAQSIMFFVGGYEAISATIAFTLHELCINSRIQKRLRNEILETIKNDADVTYENLRDMKYLDMVISETLRKYPPLPFIQRVCTKDYKVEDTELTVEKDTTVLVPLHGLHWDAKHFPDPERYDPERFNDENRPNITPYTYLPFSDGPKNCMGKKFALASIKLGLVHILRKYRVAKNSHTREPLSFTPVGLLQAETTVPLTFRNGCHRTNCPCFF